MTLSTLLQDEQLRSRYEKIKAFSFLRESTYDVSTKCQLRCQGCFFFADDKQAVVPLRDVERWNAFFRQERMRGISYAVLAGAEPSLVPSILRSCSEVIPDGTIATNGLRPIPRDIRYRIHVSVWGDALHDSFYRPLADGRTGGNYLDQQIRNYHGDDRVVFVFTYTDDNIAQARSVARLVASAGHRLTFNVFSNTVGTGLAAQESWLQRVRENMMDLMLEFGNRIVYSRYNAIVHTSPRSLHDQFGCPYPRAATALGRVPFGVASTFRSYRADLSHDATHDCCVPATDCSDCRHYASGSVIVTSRLDIHARSELLFRGWLDYVDTYLAVWILGYERSPDLYDGA